MRQKKIFQGSVTKRERLRRVGMKKQKIGSLTVPQAKMLAWLDEHSNPTDEHSFLKYLRIGKLQSLGMIVGEDVFDGWNGCVGTKYVLTGKGRAFLAEHAEQIARVA